MPSSLNQKTLAAEVLRLSASAVWQALEELQNAGVVIKRGSHFAIEWKLSPARHA